MKAFLILVVSLILFSCKKDATGTSGFENYFSKILICDSTKDLTSSSAKITVLGKGKGFDLLFSPLANTGKYGTIGTFDQYASPAVKMNFRYERPNKLYYWAIGSTIYEGDYYTIQSAQGKNVILHHLEIGTDKESYHYYTAE